MDTIARAVIALALFVLSANALAIDFTPHGTQPGLAWALEDPQSCMACHRGFSGNSPQFMPHSTWGGSMMANAARDPLFWAALDVANKDFPGAGDFCLRCHTPPGWMNGRVVKAIGGGSSGPGGASGCQLTGDFNDDDNKGNDYAGVTCHFCHRMMPTGPGGQAGMIGNANIWIDNATSCTTPDGSVYGGPCRRGPYTYANGMLEAPHGWVKSAYHEDSTLCGSCHDVTTPDTDVGPLKTLVLEGGVTTTRPMPIERTYSEWNSSLFSDAIYRDGLGEGASGTPAIARAQQCQSCHMRSSVDATAKACNQNPDGSRTGNLPVHEFAGANTWIPAIIKAEYANSVTGFGREADYDRTIASAQAMLAAAAQVQTSILSYTAPTAGSAGSISVRVKVTNLSGHKLPTGYSEGRRMWLNVKALSATNAVVGESAAYDPLTAELTLDGQAKVYETLQGIWTPGSPGECKIEDAGKAQFHFVLNNCIRKDNRIPPLGFHPASASDPNADEMRPVGYTYAETSAGSGTLVNYDTSDYVFTLPAGTARPIQVKAELKFQVSSKEYIEFLRDQAITAPIIPAENTLCAAGPNRPFDVGPQSVSRGEYMFQIWTNPTYGKSPPETAGSVSSITSPN
ncbi:MAG: hypothetical protein WAS23_14045 [Dokdonella sp.]|uniref:hypothetical protein n=1 Tax=Dokdonella sp. TaxID=2291710 RepID=UPI003BAE3FF1